MITLCGINMVKCWSTVCYFVGGQYTWLVRCGYTCEKNSQCVCSVGMTLVYGRAVASGPVGSVLAGPILGSL